MDLFFVPRINWLCLSFFLVEVAEVGHCTYTLKGFAALYSPEIVGKSTLVDCAFDSKRAKTYDFESFAKYNATLIMSSCLLL